MRRRSVLGAVAALTAAGAAYTVAQADPQGSPRANTPIEHVVVIFGENQSFDHYFGVYPKAANTRPGDPVFTAKAGTPAVNGLTPTLLTANPNSANPARLSRAEPVTCDHNHNYGAEQLAFNGGLMNRFVENTGGGSCADKSIVMDYYDGNSLTALWNYAQTYAMSDNHFGSTYGPSTIGAINLVAGTTHGVTPAAAGENGTMIGNSQPGLDDCSAAGATTQMTGRQHRRHPHRGQRDLGLVRGWVQAHHAPWPAGRCAARTHTNAAGAVQADYLPHHMPFQYWPSTANPHHVPPTSTALIGTNADVANHQYDLTDFDAALAAGKLPQVTFLKAVGAEDAHPGYSGPLDEQRFIVRVINALQASPEWASTAVFLAYDDSDGWYDHAYLPPQQSSDGPSDQLNGPGKCGPQPVPAGQYRGRCGPGPRLPLLVVSPWAKQNFVDTTQTEQASITRFIEDNWGLPRIGDQSFDARAQPLTNLFDFDPGHARAPKLVLESATGNPPGAPDRHAGPDGDPDRHRRPHREPDADGDSEAPDDDQEDSDQAELQGLGRWQEDQRVMHRDRRRCEQEDGVAVPDREGQQGAGDGEREPVQEEGEGHDPAQEGDQEGEVHAPHHDHADRTLDRDLEVHPLEVDAPRAGPDDRPDGGLRGR